ncbi:MAG TPA: DUF3619 family protein [Burkholderiales bacterium]
MNKTNSPQAKNELQVAYRIKRHLNSSLREIPQDRLERLRAGREQALAKQKKEAVLAVAGGGRMRFGGMHFGWAAQVVPLLALVVTLVSINQWHQTRYTQEVADIDAQMLVDELPPSAYLDRGFDTWLQRDDHSENQNP